MYGTKIPTTTAEKQAALEQGVKFDAGKPRMDLLSSIAMVEVAKVLDYGANKYADNNWRKGMLFSRCIGASLRHIFSWLGGETLDAETGFNHLAHAAVNLMFILELSVTHPEYDDRWTSGEAVTCDRTRDDSNNESGPAKCI